MTSPAPFKVGKWLVEPSLDRIRHDGEVRNLRPQVMELLVYLAERPAEVVATETLLNDLWDGRIVTEGSVYNCVSELRVALTTDKDDDPAIETIPKKGYRLVASVCANVGPGVGSPRRRLLALVVAVTFVGIAVAYWIQAGRVPGDRITSIAMLPLDYLSPDPASNEYLADGMTEVVVASLGRLQNLRVISRTTSAQVKARNLTIPEIASELDVDAVIEGSVMSTGERQVRITLQLIDGHTDGHLWSRDYVGDADDIIRLQDEVAQSVTAEIYARLEGPTRGQVSVERAPPTTNADAYRAYLKGRFRFNQFGEQNFRQALQHYDEAIALDPSFALAYAARAEVCMQPIVMSMRILTLDDCYEDATRATEFDDTRAEGHAALGFAQLLRWEWDEAGQSLDRAIEINPNSAMARQWRTLYFRMTYRFEEALEEIRFAEERDFLNLFVRTMVSWPLYDMQRFDEALAQLDDVLDIAPEFTLAHYNRGLVYIELRDIGGVFAAADQVAANAGPESFEARLLRASGEAIEGNGAEARRLVASLEADGATFMAAWIARIYLLLGDENAAFERLERGLAERAVDMPALAEPQFNSIRQRPRFKAIVQQLGLPQIG